MMRIFWCRGLPPTMALVLGWIALLSVGSATSTAAPCGAAGGMAGRVGRSACTMGLRGGRELEQETRRKPFDENVEAADVILKDYKKKGAHAPSALEFLLGDTLLKLADADRCIDVVCCDFLSHSLPKQCREMKRSRIKRKNVVMRNMQQPPFLKEGSHAMRTCAVSSAMCPKYVVRVC